MEVPDSVFNSFSPYQIQEKPTHEIPTILHLHLVDETQIRVHIGLILSAYTVHSIDDWGS